jgi:V/A-type H+-transporting ATPase subunit B
MQQLVRYTRVHEILDDVIRLHASGVALGDMAEVENTDGETSLARGIGVEAHKGSELFSAGE